MDKRRELKDQYKEMRPEMGLLSFRRNQDGRCFLDGVQDTKSRINRYLFQLKNGSHPNRLLQQAWQEAGADGFTVEVLEVLEYDKDGLKTDYSADLATLKQLWMEKLAAEGVTFFQPVVK